MELDWHEIEDEWSLLKEEVIEDEQDLPPEYCHYRDEGCEFAEACLSCPFPQCIYEVPRGKQHCIKEFRNREIARLFRTGRWELKDLALMFGISLRTIQRALKSAL